jgi:hypothetical protein
MKPCIIGLLLVFTSCQRYADPATYILPRGTKGPAVVIFSQPTGAPAIFRDGRRLYVIPANGVLKTRFEYQDGWRDDLFLMKGDKGYDTLNMGDTFGLVTRYNTFLMFYRRKPDSNGGYHLDPAFMYEIFTVGTARSGLDTLYQKPMDSLINMADQMIEEATQNQPNVK